MDGSFGPQGPLRGPVPAMRIFDGLPERDRERLACMAHRRGVPAGTRLVTSPGASPCVYLIRRGFVKAMQDSEAGDEVILAILGPGDLLGDIGLGERGPRAESVLAIEPLELIVFGQQAFLECAATMPALSLNLLAHYTARLTMASDRIESLATSDVEARLKRVLLDLAHAFGESADGGCRLPFRLTQVDLAAMIGASRVRVNQTLGELRRAGEVSVEDGQFTIRDPSLLPGLYRQPY
ncbi:MAG: Crp/Fnr family transcriptional regulator, partial [Thermomicrobiales bacterium]